MPSVIYSFRVHVDSDLFKWMEAYEGSISELVRNVVHAHAFNEADHDEYRKFLSLQRRGETWRFARLWLLDNMSPNHYDKLMKYIRDSRKGDI